MPHPQNVSDFVVLVALHIVPHRQRIAGIQRVHEGLVMPAVAAVEIERGVVFAAGGLPQAVERIVGIG